MADYKGFRGVVRSSDGVHVNYLAYTADEDEAREAIRARRGVDVEVAFVDDPKATDRCIELKIPKGEAFEE